MSDYYDGVVTFKMWQQRIADDNTVDWADLTPAQRHWWASKEKAETVVDTSTETD